MATGLYMNTIAFDSLPSYSTWRWTKRLINFRWWKKNLIFHGKYEVNSNGSNNRFSNCLLGNLILNSWMIIFAHSAEILISFFHTFIKLADLLMFYFNLRIFPAKNLTREFFYYFKISYYQDNYLILKYCWMKRKNFFYETIFFFSVVNFF